MKVKLFDEEHEIDLEESINDFLDDFDGEIIDIKFTTCAFLDDKEQIFSFSAMILYE